MEYSLKNSFLEIKVSDKGGELTSIKNSSGIEYLWFGNSEFWGRQAPVLFPIVGKVSENNYTHQGKEYTLSQHGFARDMVFELCDRDSSFLSFKLSSNKLSKSKYPFDFEFFITYILKDREVFVEYTVINKDKEPMYFKLGAHPGFNLPIFQDKREDYYLEFEKEESCQLLSLTSEGYFTKESRVFKGSRVDISVDTFVNDALVFAEIASKEIFLSSKNQGKILGLKLNNFPFLGIWSLPSGAPFVCLEPWFGHGDFIDDSRELALKRDMIELPSKKVFETSYSLCIYC